MPDAVPRQRDVVRARDRRILGLMAGKEPAEPGFEAFTAEHAVLLLLLAAGALALGLLGAHQRRRGLDVRFS